MARINHDGRGTNWILYHHYENGLKITYVFWRFGVLSNYEITYTRDVTSWKLTKSEKSKIKKALDSRILEEFREFRFLDKQESLKTSVSRDTELWKEYLNFQYRLRIHTGKTLHHKIDMIENDEVHFICKFLRDFGSAVIKDPYKTANLSRIYECTYPENKKDKRTRFVSVREEHGQYVVRDENGGYMLSVLDLDGISQKLKSQAGFIKVSKIR
jgi:hypothetical protein